MPPSSILEEQLWREARSRDLKATFRRAKVKASIQVLSAPTYLLVVQLSTSEQCIRLGKQAINKKHLALIKKIPFTLAFLWFFCRTRPRPLQVDNLLERTYAFRQKLWVGSGDNGTLVFLGRVTGERA